MDGERVSEEMAHDMAIASNRDRGDAAYSRQTADLLDKLNSDKITRAQANEEVGKLDRQYYPEGGAPSVDNSVALRRDADNSDERAGRLEYWAGILHGKEGKLRPEDMVYGENVLAQAQADMDGYISFRDELPDLIQKRGKDIAWLRGETGLERFMSVSETHALVQAYDVALRALMGNQDTTVGDIIELKRKLIDDCRLNEEYGLTMEIKRWQDFLNSVITERPPIATPSEQ